MNCEHCHVLYQDGTCYCPKCGSKLISVKTNVVANIGKKGITSYSIKLPNGVTINSKGSITTKLGKGISYTTKLNI